MAFYANAFSTLQYEITGISDSTTVLPLGAAVKISKIPVGVSSPDFYYQFALATPTDTAFGVVSAMAGRTPITNALPGKVVAINAGLIPVLMNGAAMKGDLIKVKTMDGKWDKVGAGETSDAELVEDATAGNLAWAKPIRK